MGNNCGTYPPPDTTNICAISVGGISNMPNFCTYSGSEGDSYRNEYCSLMSTGGEWTPGVSTFTCYYDTCQPYLNITQPGCCQNCCTSPGSTLVCRRIGFTGDPAQCCLNDLTCTANPDDNPPQCYSDSMKQNACADGQNGEPNYRSIVSTDCQDVLLQYCTGTLSTDNPTSTAWLDRWTVNNGGPGSCVNALQRNIFSAGGTGHCFIPPAIIPGSCNIPPPIPFDAEGYFWGQRLLSAALARYEQQGFAIGSLPGFPGYNPWQDFIYTNVCCPYPGLCQDGLNGVCATKTAQRISLNPAVAQWCGCHLPEGEYQSYSVKFNIPPECTPMCNRVGTIPIVGINGEAVTCKQAVCLIDGVTVNLVGSQIGGGIDFNQICGNCGNAQCSCIISNTTVDIVNSMIGGSVVPIDQGCGSLTCAQTNPGITGPGMINVPCSATGAFNPYAQYEEEVAAAKAEAKKESWLWTLLAVGIALVLIFFIILFV